MTYSDYGELGGGKATVMKYNNQTQSWINVGATGFSVGEAYFNNLILNSKDVPYVAYSESADGSTGKATVMKY